jgi:hypothetical protein
VVHFHTHRLYFGLISSDIALLSLEVPGVAFDGDLRKPPDLTLFMVIGQTYVDGLIDHFLTTALLRCPHSWSHS